MKLLAKLSYSISLISIALLITWCLGLVVTVVFDLKTFDQKSTEFLGMSVLLILASGIGAGLINLLSNVGIISNHITDAKGKDEIKGIKIGIKIFAGINILVVVGMFVGNQFSQNIKEKELISELNQISERSAKVINTIPAINLEKENVKKASDVLEYIGEINPKLSMPTIIFKGKYLGEDVLLRIHSNIDTSDSFATKLIKSDTTTVKKTFIDTTQFLLRTEEKLRTELFAAFAAGEMKPFVYDVDENRPSAYKMIKINGASVIIRMSKYSRYGRSGS